MGIGKILAISLSTLASLGTIGGITAFLVTNKQNTSSVSIDESSSVNKKEVNEEKEMVIETKKEPERKVSDETIEEIKKQIKGEENYAWAAGANSDLKPQASKSEK